MAVYTEGSVDWQAFTEIAVYDIRVFILASLQQPPDIKQSLFDSGCAPGKRDVFFFSVCPSDECCFASFVGLLVGARGSDFCLIFCGAASLAAPDRARVIQTRCCG